MHTQIISQPTSVLIQGRFSTAVRVTGEQRAGSLNEVRRNGKGRILAVLGRRQVGRSTAVSAFVEQVDTPHAYFTGVKLAPMHRQLEALTEAFLGSRIEEAAVYVAGEQRPAVGGRRGAGPGRDRRDVHALDGLIGIDRDGEQP